MFSRIGIHRPLLLLIFLLNTLAGFAQNADIEAKFRNALKGKPITMHRFYRELNQSYDENGAPTFKASECSWTICSGFLVQDVRFRPDHVEFSGTRLFVGFGPSGQSNYDSKEKMKIRIALAHSVDPEKEAIRAIQTVFLHDNEDISSFVPEFWRHCLRDKVCTGVNNALSGAEISKALQRATTQEGTKTTSLRVGYNVTPPKALAIPDPEFTPEARKVKFQGSVLLTAAVDSDGSVRDVRITRALGVGLDEAAIQKVSKEWRFKPALKDGNPVPVQVGIEVNFHLY